MTKPVDPLNAPARGLPLSTVERLYSYYILSLHAWNSGRPHISSAQLARYMSIGDTQVRKDMAAIGLIGQPRHGYPLETAIRTLRLAMGIDQKHPAVLSGVGNLGTALLEYSRLSEFGFQMCCAFDVRDGLVGSSVGGVQVLHSKEMPKVLRRLQAEIGVIAVPVWAAQEVCNTMIAGGIRAIWNFAPLHLAVPANVLVINEDFAGSLSVIAHYLKRSSG